MIYETLHKINGSKNIKTHLGLIETNTALCHMADVAGEGNIVEMKNRKWFIDGKEISEYEVKKSFCAYCEAIAYCDERTGRR